MFERIFRLEDASHLAVSFFHPRCTCDNTVALLKRAERPETLDLHQGFALEGSFD